MKSGMENAKAKGKKIGQRPTTKEDIPSNYLTHSSCPRQAAPAHGVYPQGGLRSLQPTPKRPRPSRV